MDYETIVFEVQDAIATIRLNRPESYNALNIQAYQELIDALKQCRRNNSIRVVVLTGSGKAFSSGADLLEMQSQLGNFDISEMLRQSLNQIVMAIRTLEKPVIAAINGVAAGAGAGIALACDLRFASESASFVFASFVNIGLIPDAGTTYFLPRLVGANTALELALLADAKHRVSVADAHRLGIVNRVIADDALDDSVLETAQRLAKMAPKAIGLTKRAIYQSAGRSLDDSLETEAKLQGIAFKTQDFQEGVMAFIEKRDPNFTGS